MKIKINLTESKDAKDFSPKDNSLIHRTEFDRVIGWINDRVRQIKKNDNAQEFPRIHDTISVFGARGTGKTSFLLSIKQYCSADSENNIQVLKIIDPTLIEEKGHFFLNIVSLIKEIVDKKLDGIQCEPTSSDYTRKLTWNRTVESLAHGLPSLDGIGSKLTNLDWQDPEYIMQKGIMSVTSSRKLEENFNKVVKDALEILNRNAFLLVLDDIDVSFTKGWPVLETIRKYLTSPQVIVILSGDFKLFSLAIRKQQWKNFGKSLLINECEQLGNYSNYNDIVTALESQYMRKVLKPELRIHLTTLGEKLSYKNRDINISEDEIVIVTETNGKDNANMHNFSKEIEITKMYDKILGRFGINNSYQASAYRSYLLSLPLRTQINFLSVFTNNSKASLQKSIADVFLSEMYDKNVPINIIEVRKQFLSPVILNLLIQEQQLSETYQLQPTTSDDTLNACLTALNFIFSENIKTDPSLIFDYFIKIGYLRNLLDVLGYQKENNYNADNVSISNPSIEGLCKHAALLQDKVLRDSASLMISYMMSVNDTTRNGNNQPQGSIQLKGLSFKSRRNESGRIDAILEEANIIERTLIGQCHIC